MSASTSRSRPDPALPERAPIRYARRRRSPRRTSPPRTTAASTPTLARFCWAAVRRLFGSLGRSLWASVVITQRGQAPVTCRRTASPMASVRPIQPSSTIPVAGCPLLECTHTVATPSFEAPGLLCRIVASSLTPPPAPPAILAYSRWRGRGRGGHMASRRSCSVRDRRVGSR